MDSNKVVAKLEGKDHITQETLAQFWTTAPEDMHWSRRARSYEPLNVRERNMLLEALAFWTDDCIRTHRMADLIDDEYARRLHKTRQTASHSDHLMVHGRLVDVKQNPKKFLEYKRLMAKYKREYFDVFKRGKRILIRLDSGEVWCTTIGNMNYGEFSVKNGVQADVEKKKPRIKQEQRRIRDEREAEKSVGRGAPRTVKKRRRIVEEVPAAAATMSPSAAVVADIPTDQFIASCGAKKIKGLEMTPEELMLAMKRGEIAEGSIVC